MKMLSIIGASLLLIVAVVACGSRDEGRILHMEGFDITEAAYRNVVRSVLIGPDAVIGCKMIQNSTPQELMNMGTPEPDETLPLEATPIPDQIANPDDLIRAGTIIKEECARILP